MFFPSDDPARDAERYMAELDKKLARRPKCDCCGEHIQDECALKYKGMWLCGRCVYDNSENIDDIEEEE